VGAATSRARSRVWAASGDYTLLMRVKDELSGKTLDLREPFHVGAPPPQRASAASSPSR
jgi:hypothetical protein